MSVDSSRHHAAVVSKTQATIWQGRLRVNQVSQNPSQHSINQSNLFAAIIIKYIQSNNKQRQATRKAELAAEYNLNVATIHNKQIRRKRKKKRKNTEEVIIIRVGMVHFTQWVKQVG